jgi:phosphotransferase system enzyme I (PtsI)
VKTLTGVAASPGAAVGDAYVYEPDAYELPTRPTQRVELSLVDVARALEGVAATLEEAAGSSSGASSEILRAQAAMARDPALLRSARTLIEAGAHPARAVVAAGEDFAGALERSGNEYLAARAADVRHICDVASRAIVGAPPRRPPQPARPCVIVAEDLMPADVAALDARLVRGIVTSRGSSTSHTSLIARALGIPAVVGVRRVVGQVSSGLRVGLNGCTGEVAVEPDAPTVQQLEAAEHNFLQQRQRRRSAAGSGPATTADGVRVEIAANVSSLEELSAALAEGAEGVGLLRTELLYLDRDRPPTELEQAELLRAMRGLLGDKRLVIRTFDFGTDKQVPFLPVRPERNPELGVRGLRLAQLHPELLDAQLRAIAAVAASGPTAVMAPMVATAAEARWFVNRVAAAGMPTGTEVGVMVEIPALALTADSLAPHVDFMSIGTNDLMQYLFAADRRDEGLAHLHDPFSPAVLRVVSAVCRGAGELAWVGVCGEAANDPAWALLAVGLGVRELSMQAFSIAPVRAALANVAIAACRDAARLALDASSADDVRSLAKALLKESP